MTRASAPDVSYRFVLFVAGQQPDSVQAQENLQGIREEYLLTGISTVTIVDVVTDFQAALDYDVLVTPTLVVDGPRGRSTIVGNLSDVDRVVSAIGCN